MKNITLTISLLFFAISNFASSATAQSAQDAELLKLNADVAKAFAAGNFDEALAGANKIVQLNIERFGKESLESANALANRGILEIATDDFKRGTSDLEDAVEIYSKQTDLSREQGSAFATILEMLGGLRVKKEVLSGQSAFELAIKWREKSNGPDAIENAMPLASLANVLYWKRQFKLSAESYRMALLVLSKNKFDPSAPDRTNVYERARCAFRKANLDDKFILLHNEYQENLKTNPSPVQAIAGGVVNGKATYLPKPSYPQRAGNIQETVEVDVLINESGAVISACAKDGNKPSFMEASEIAAFKSQFSPTTVNGHPLKVTGRIVYHFVP